MRIRNKNIKLIVNYVLGPLVLLFLLITISRQLQEQPDWQQSFYRILPGLQRGDFLILSGVLVLMLVNWGIEAKKWQLAMRGISTMSFGTSLKAVFSGTAFALFSPNRTGEYLGRMLPLPEENRISSLPRTAVCSFAQLIITLLAGSAGVLFLKPALEAGGLPEGATLGILTLAAITGISAILLTIFYFRLPWLIQWLKQRPGLAKRLSFMRLEDRLNATILLQILSLSGGRFLVFLVQYYLLFGVFEVEMDWWQTFWIMPVVFLVIAIVPTIAVITELAVRWEASLEIIRLFSSNTTGILATSCSIWFINMVMPALIGGLLILRLRIFKKHEIVQPAPTGERSARGRLFIHNGKSERIT